MLMQVIELPSRPQMHANISASLTISLQTGHISCGMGVRWETIALRAISGVSVISIRLYPGHRWAVLVVYRPRRRLNSTSVEKVSRKLWNWRAISSRETVSLFWDFQTSSRRALGLDFRSDINDSDKLDSDVVGKAACNWEVDGAEFKTSEIGAFASTSSVPASSSISSNRSWSKSWSASSSSMMLRWTFWTSDLGESWAYTWGRNLKWITFVMSFASCVEGLMDILSWPTCHGTGKTPTLWQSPWKMSSSLPSSDAPERWSCSWVSSGKTSGSKLMRIFPWPEPTTKCYKMFSSYSAS